MPLSLTYCRIFWSSSKDFDLCESRNSSGVQHQKSIIPPQSDLLEVRNRLKRPDRPAARPFSHIPSKTACRGFDFFCPCHEKSPKPRVSGLFLCFFGGPVFRGPRAKPEGCPECGVWWHPFSLVPSGTASFQHQRASPRAGVLPTRGDDFCVSYSSNPAVMPANRAVSFFT